MASLSSLAATVTTDPSTEILSATAEFLPEMAAVGAGAIVVGAGILVWRRGWGFFKGLSK